MADFDSSLPVRTHNDGDVVAIIADSSTPSQQLTVGADGSINTNIRASNQDPLTATGTALDVYIQGGSSSGGVPDQSAFAYGTDLEAPVGGVYDDTGVTLSSGTTGALRLTAERGLHANLRNASGTEIATASNPLRIDPTGDTAQPVTDNGGSLTIDGTVELGATTLSALESITVQNGSGGSAVNIQDGGNSITVDGTVSVTGSSVSVTNFPAAVDTNYGTVGASTIRTAAQIGNATGAANFGSGSTGAQTLRVEANQGAANSTPWNVSVQQIGTPINDYKQAASISAGATDNHDYTVTSGKTLFLQRVEGSASDVARFRIQVETGVGAGTYDTYDNKFNSTANPNVEAKFDSPIQVAAGVKVRIAILNRSLLSAQDLYSRICGYEI